MTLKPERIAVIGAGIIGCAVAHRLSMEGHEVCLIDRSEPGRGGASYGNVAHIAAELVQPLPSPRLLIGFWRELFALGGPLDIPLRRLPSFVPWARQFAVAAFRRRRHTQFLAPLVKSAASEFTHLLGELGRPELLKRNGHYQVWFGPHARRRAQREATGMRRLGIPTAAIRSEVLANIARSARASTIAGLHFPESAHVVDPLEVARALLAAAVSRGTSFHQELVLAIRPHVLGIEILTTTRCQVFDAAVVCAGPWSAPLLNPFALNTPLEAAYGYHVELEEHAPQVDAPLIYVDRSILVTPLEGRLRASSFMEFRGLDSEPDPRKPQRLRGDLRRLGYRCAEGGFSWRGARPVLPDYLPGIGRAVGAQRLFYAIGHQHLGLTMAPITARLVADLIAGRTPEVDISPFDLRRFGSHSSSYSGAS